MSLMRDKMRDLVNARTIRRAFRLQDEGKTRKRAL